ncbi:MAG: hypothetical protein Q4B84_02915 [Clostridia bacterium]|nr:hypothetical protein [Clostridia bacterium]
MINFIKKIELHKPKNQKNDSQESKNDIEYSKKQDLIKEIKIICNELDKTNIWFQMEKDSDLIDACIHQREVLHARYRYLINKIKFDKIS